MEELIVAAFTAADRISGRILDAGASRLERTVLSANAVRDAVTSLPLSDSTRLIVDVGLTDRELAERIAHRRRALLKALNLWQRALHALALGQQPDQSLSMQARAALANAIGAACNEWSRHDQFQSGTTNLLELDEIPDPLADQNLVVMIDNGAVVRVAKGLEPLADVLQGKNPPCLIVCDADAYAQYSAQESARIALGDIAPLDSLANRWALEPFTDDDPAGLDDDGPLDLSDDDLAELGEDEPAEAGEEDAATDDDVPQDKSEYLD